MAMDDSDQNASRRTTRLSLYISRNQWKKLDATLKEKSAATGHQRPERWLLEKAIRRRAVESIDVLLKYGARIRDRGVDLLSPWEKVMGKGVPGDLPLLSELTKSIAQHCDDERDDCWNDLHVRVSELRERGLHYPHDATTLAAIEELQSIAESMGEAISLEIPAPGPAATQPDRIAPSSERRGSRIK